MAQGRLRVCLASEEQEGWGGIGTYTAVLARALCQLGHTVHVLLRDWERDRQEQLDGMTVHRLTVPEPSWRRGSEPFLERLYEAREALLWSRRVGREVQAIAARDGLDVLELPEHRGAGVLCGAGRHARGRVALVVRLHTPVFLTEQANERHERTLDQRAVELLERVALRRATALTAPSRAVAAAIAGRWKLTDGQVQVIPNPIDEDLFSPLPPPERPGCPLIVCVGRLERIKGVDVLVQALPRILDRHPDAKVRLVGEDDPHGWDGASMASHLRERAAALGLPDTALQIDGALPRSELPGLLRSASLCVVPSRWENLPYSCIEAMACGRPVVASAVGGLRELISDGVDGLLVKPADASELAAAACHLLDDDAYAGALGEAARATVERRFSQRAVAETTARAYQVICRGAH